ncbi:TIGR01244 family sulfur transferase [Haliea sp. E17]|uniref:TIGR01244 family sulfur transferase n=1 Tax=Haliea sp. E17 TaxID=3401576 RepID=UPI003AAD0B54
MQAYKLTETLAVCGQISPAVVAEIAAAGFKVLINNRPDGEEPGQPGSAEIRAAAEQAGLEYYYMPVNAMTFPGEDLAGMGRLFDDPERPVFAYCRTGTRCANLWVASRPAGDREAATVLAQKIGFDLSLAARIS